MKDPLRYELINCLKGEGAHVNFDQAIADIPPKFYGAEVPGLPYTLWRVLQHMQISQRDILDYMLDPHYRESVWPDDYWPKQKAPPNAKSWTTCVKAFQKDQEALVKIIKNPKTKLLEPIPHIKNGPTILHECLLVADHNAYHIGQLILLRGMLGIWED